MPTKRQHFGGGTGVAPLGAQALGVTDRDAGRSIGRASLGCRKTALAVFNFPMILFRVVAPALLSLLCGAAAQEPTFSSQSNVVLVPALVKGEDGRAVYGLEAKDFVIEDDGVEQKIKLDEAAEEEPVSVIVAIQCGREAKHELPRMQGLSSMLEPILTQPQNRIALVEFDTQVNLVQDFTNDSSLIEQGLKNLKPGDTGAAIYDAVNYSVNLLNKLPDAGQRVLLLISETRDHGSHWAKLDDVVALIGDSNTAVYALAFSPALSNVLDTERGKRWEDAQAGPPSVIPLIVLAMEAMRKNAPEAIASMTGGEYALFESRNRFETHMLDFTNHLRSRYLLSFQPQDPHAGLHQIRMRLRRKDAKKQSVLARSSYWAGGTEPNRLPGTD
jgi:VWFA-related protein